MTILELSRKVDMVRVLVRSDTKMHLRRVIKKQSTMK